MYRPEARLYRHRVPADRPPLHVKPAPRTLLGQFCAFSGTGADHNHSYGVVQDRVPAKRPYLMLTYMRSSSYYMSL